MAPPSLYNMGLIAIMLWEIWSCRNKLVHENRIPNFASIFNKAVSLFDDYALFNPSSQRPPAPTDPATWSTPTTKPWKINVDAAF